MNNETRIESDPCVPDFYSSSPVLRQRVFAHLHKGTAVLTEDVETWLVRVFFFAVCHCPLLFVPFLLPYF